MIPPSHFRRMEPMKEVQAKIMNHIKGSEFIREKMSMSHIRTLFEMIGTGEERPFSVPPSVLFLTRINSNIDYFIVNYIIIFALILFVLLYVLYLYYVILLFLHDIHRLTDLFRLFACSVLVLLWILALRKLKQSEEVLQFNIAGRVIGSRHVLIALGVGQWPDI